LALNHIIGRAVHEAVPPLGLSFWRWFVAAACLFPFVLGNWQDTLNSYRRHWRDFIALGGLIIGATSLILVALRYTTATNVALINATQPAVTVLLSWLIYHVRLERNHILGILISFCGVLVMVCKGRLEPLLMLDFNRGDLLAMLSMFGFAGYAVRYVRTSHGLGPVRTLFGVIVAGCVMLLPFYIAETVWLAPVPVNATSITAILAIALLVSVAAMLMWNKGNTMVGANRASIFMNLVPVFGALMAVSMLGETFELYHLSGMAMICAGVWLVVGRASGFSPRCGMPHAGSRSVPPWSTRCAHRPSLRHRV
jgi:drug/metabolite transporter (DMT)-like permease